MSDIADRIPDLMAWCASYLGNSIIHRRIRELLDIPDDAYPWQTDAPKAKQHGEDDHEFLADASICWRCNPDLVLP